jgi:hypothetical protein
MSLPKHTLKVFIRDRDRRPRGMVVAIKGNSRRDCTNSYSIGWSMAHNKLDVYDEKVGQEIALTRAADADKQMQTYLSIPIPSEISRVMLSAKFLDRCERYFSGPSKDTSKKKRKSKKGKTPNLDEILKQIKAAKSDERIKKIVAEFACSATMDSSLRDECESIL